MYRDRSESRALGVAPQLGFWIPQVLKYGESPIMASNNQKLWQDFIITGSHVHQYVLECKERSSLQVDSKHFNQKVNVCKFKFKQS